MEESIYYHKTKMEEVYESTVIEEFYKTMSQFLLGKSEKFVNLGSGWIFEKTEYLTIEVNEFTPISGGTYKDLPKRIINKKAVTNMKNNDDECFKWSILRRLNPKEKNSERIDSSLREKVKDFNWEGIKFPVRTINF